MSSYFSTRIKKRIEDAALVTHDSRESFMRATGGGEIDLVAKLPPDQEAEVFRIQREYMARWAKDADVVLASDADIRAALRTGVEQ